MKKHKKLKLLYLSTVSQTLFEFPKSVKGSDRKLKSFPDKLQYFINFVSIPQLIELLNQTKTDLPMHFTNFLNFQYNFILLESSIQPIRILNIPIVLTIHIIINENIIF